MYKLKVVLSQPANYVYHMLSVSKVGYDNSYSKKYETIHVKEDLDTLKEYELELTVSGGEHCGLLYVLLVTKAAVAGSMDSLMKYYEAIIDLFTENDNIRTANLYNYIGDEFLDHGTNSFEDMFLMILEMFSSYSNQIIEVSKVMIRNIDIYVNKVWEKESKILNDYIVDFEEALNYESNLVAKWESVLKKELLVENFEIVLVNSIEDGAQAIDISETKDIFNINSNINDLIGFISHEIGSYLIIQSLPQLMKEQMEKYWLCIESLSTYHNQKVLFEDENLFAKENNYFSKFDELYGKEEHKEIAEIIERAVN